MCPNFMNTLCIYILDILLYDYYFLFSHHGELQGHVVQGAAFRPSG